MGVDRASDGTDTNAETIEKQSDRRPPPPPDEPGTDGYPSRADSRNGAAAANDTSSQKAENQTEDKFETSQPSQEPVGERDSTSTEQPRRPESNEASTDGRRTTGSEIDTGGAPETEQRPEQVGDVGKQKQALDGQATPQDKAGTAEADEQPTLADTSSGQHTVDIADRTSVGTDEPVPVSKANETPRESLDDHHEGVTDEARETGRPPVAAPESIGPAGGSEDQQRVDAAHQSDTRRGEDTAHPADVETKSGQDEQPRPDGPTTGHLEEMSEVAESSGGAVAARSDKETIAERPEDLDGEAASEVEPEQQAGGNSTESKHRTYEFNVGSTPVRVRIDPVGAAVADKTIPAKDTEPEPAGDRIANAEDGKRSREDRFRKKAYEVSDDTADIVGEAGKTVHDFLAERPPTGHSMTRSSPELSRAPHEGIDVGDTASGIVAAGILVGEFGYRAYRGVRRRRGK
ncbi:MAG TPA: hypothetical protein VGD53_26380 [Actinoallomurus sp.]|jgi:hypothetical protein